MAFLKVGDASVGQVLQSGDLIKCEVCNTLYPSSLGYCPTCRGEFSAPVPGGLEEVGGISKIVISEVKDGLNS